MFTRPGFYISGRSSCCGRPRTAGTLRCSDRGSVAAQVRWRGMAGRPMESHGDPTWIIQDFHRQTSRQGKASISIPIGSMYGIYANIGGILMVNVSIYTIHGSYGIVLSSLKNFKQPPFYGPKHVISSPYFTPRFFTGCVFTMIFP